MTPSIETDLTVAVRSTILYVMRRIRVSLHYG
uniref:Uncharacterized protein n=1 Tax=Tetranychus urticae TaxID=32264 RepID=T1JXP2_TETUR